MADLLPLVHALKYTPGQIRRKTLYLVSPADLEEYFRTCLFAVLSPPRTFRLEFLQTSEAVRLGDCRITACPTLHSRESVAFKVDSEGRSVVFTGDTDYGVGLVDFCRDVDLLVADCSFPDEMKMGGHMVPSECGRLATEAGAGHLVLSHLYATEVPDAARVTQAARAYAGPISLAEDFSEYDVGQSGKPKTWCPDQIDRGGNP